MRFMKSAQLGEHDFELNLASVIDCFTVLVIYLLVSASFVSMGAFDVSDLTQRPAGNQIKEPSASLSMKVTAWHEIILKVEDDADKLEPEVVIPPAEGGVDRATLLHRLVELKQKHPKLDTAVMSSNGEVEYLDIVRITEAVKELIPSVYLGERLVQ